MSPIEAMANPSANDTATNAQPQQPSGTGEADQSVMMRQSPLWPRLAIFTILGVVTFGVGWAYFARIEHAVSARGQLEPQGEVKPVEAPIKGVVKDVAVEDGDRVDKGDRLLSFQSDSSQAQLSSLQQRRQMLRQQTRFYRRVIGQPTSPSDVSQTAAQLEVPVQLASLTKNRAALEAENRLLRAQIGMATPNGNLSAEERARLEAARTSSSSEVAAAQYEVDQLQQRLARTRTQIENAWQTLKVRANNIRQQLEVERSILNDYSSLVKEGAVAELQYTRQKQKVQQQQNKLAELREQQRGRIQELQKQQQRLQAQIAQAREQTTQTQSSSRERVLEQIAQNRQQIAQIDSRLNQNIVDNENRLAELKSQIAQARQQRQYQTLEAPVAGTVFDLQVGADSVARPSDTLLKLVPNDDLVAKVFIRNKNIGFVEEGMKVDVRVDTYPFSQFGDVTGTVTSVGSEALPPNDNYDYFRFPAKVKLKTQHLPVGEGKAQKQLPLRSGMSVSTNIIVREDRRVIDLFIQRFTSAVDSLRNVR